LTRVAGRGTAVRGGRTSLLLGAWASGVFAVMWIGAILGMLGDGAVFREAWAWLGSLGPGAAVVGWVLFLPACIGLWATQSGLPVPAVVAVLALLVAWTAVAWAGLARRLATRRG
jgi:hypothetical protein